MFAWFQSGHYFPHAWVCPARALAMGMWQRHDKAE